MFDRTAEEEPNPFIDGRLITIKEENLGSAQIVRFEYDIPVDAVTYWKPQDLPEAFDLKSGLEVGLYTGWVGTCDMLMK